MERRKFLIGAGSLAAGSAAAMGTGAFTSVQADRTVNVAVADDSAALLALTTDPDGDGTAEANNADYVDTTGSAVSINVDNAAGTDGTGVNADATTQINDLFRVVNQGTQAAVVYVDPDSISSDNHTSNGSGIMIDPQATSRPNGDYENTSGIDQGIEDDQISLTGNGNGPDYIAYNDGNSVDDAREEFVLESGESFEFGLWVSTDSSVNKNSSISETIEIIADTTLVPDSYEGDDN